MMIFGVAAVVWQATMVPGVLNGILHVSPFICKAHEVVDRLGLGSTQLLSEVPSNETIPESVNCSFG
jgi:hypothetical protein